MKRLFIYPFDQEMDMLFHLANLTGKLENAEIIPLNNKENLHILKNATDGKTDSIFLSFLPEMVENTDMYEAIIRVALNRQIPMIMTKAVYENYSKSVEYSGVDIINPPIDTSGLNVEHKNLIMLDIPVISIIGSGAYCDKFLTQIQVRNMLQANGLRISQIGTKEYSALFGIDPYPSFMFDSTISSRQKIKLLNQVAVNIIQRDKSDVLILGIPGGIMPLSPYEFKEFGEQAFLANFAIPADYSILNLYYEEYTDASIQTLLSICKFRFNMKIYCVNFTNKILFMPTDEKKEKSFSVSKEKIQDARRGLSLSDTLFLSLNCQADRDALQKSIMTTLANPFYEE